MYKRQGKYRDRDRADCRDAAAGTGSDRIYLGRRDFQGGHLGDEHLWQDRGTIGQRRHHEQGFHDRGGEPDQITGHHAEDRQRLQRGNGLYYYIKRKRPQS